MSNFNQAEKFNMRSALWFLIMHYWKKDSMKQKLSLPGSIDNYRLVAPVVREPGDDEYQLAIYQDGFGRKGIAKQWCGSKKDIRYYWLQNEIRVYQGINYLQEIQKNTIFEKFPHITIPKLLKVIQEKNRIILFIEMIDGERIKNFPMSKRVEVFEVVLNYFNFLAGHTNEASLNKFFLKRRSWQIILLFFLVLVKSALMYPSVWRDLLRGAGVFIRFIPLIVKQKQLIFVHRDLTCHNILITKDKKIGIIDFELSVLCNPMFEITQIVTGSWRQENFWQEFYKLPTMKKILSNPKLNSLYRAFSVYTAVHRLASSPAQDFNLHLSYLRHALDLKNS